MKKSDEEITAYMRKHQRCPDCRGDEFLEGPSGGMSTNIMCSSCGARFNMSPFGAERIGEPTKIPAGCIPAMFEEEACQPLLSTISSALAVSISGSDTNSGRTEKTRGIFPALATAVRNVFTGGRRPKEK